MEIGTLNFSDILKVFVGPILGFIAAYYFNIFQIKRREAAKRNMLQYILKESTFELSASIDKTSKSLEGVLNSLQLWISALHSGIINYGDDNGKFSVVSDIYKLDDVLDDSIFDGIFTVTVYNIQEIEIASEMMRLSFLKSTDYRLISLTLNLERAVKDYNISAEKLHQEMDDLRREVVSHIDGVIKVEDLESNVKIKNGLTVSLQKMRNYVMMSFIIARQLDLILEELSPLIASSTLSSSSHRKINWFGRNKDIEAS